VLAGQHSGTIARAERQSPGALRRGIDLLPEDQGAKWIEVPGRAYSCSRKSRFVHNSTHQRGLPSRGRPADLWWSNDHEQALSVPTWLA